MKSKSKQKLRKKELFDIIEFLKTEIKIEIHSDKQLINLEPNFIIDCIYKTCNFLNLVKNSEIAKKINKKYDEEISEENLSFMMKFIVIKEIYKKFFDRDCNLLDFMAPKMKKVKILLNDLMDFHERISFFKLKFDDLINEIAYLKIQNDKKEKDLFLIQEQIKKYEIQKNEEKPILEEIENSIFHLEKNIIENSNLLVKKENVLKIEESEILKKKENLENLENDLKKNSEKKNYLENQIVGNFEEILNKKKQMKEKILDWREKIKKKNNDFTKYSKKKLTINFYKDELKKSVDNLKMEKNQENILKEMEKRLIQEKKELEENQNTLLENEKNKKQIIFIIENEKKNLNLNILQRNRDQENYDVEINRLEIEKKEKFDFNKKKKIFEENLKKENFIFHSKKLKNEDFIKKCQYDLDRIYDKTDDTVSEYLDIMNKKCY